jgi:hypothetical protein
MKKFYVIIFGWLFLRWLKYSIRALWSKRRHFLRAGKTDDGCDNFSNTFSVSSIAIFNLEVSGISILYWFRICTLNAF